MSKPIAFLPLTSCQKCPHMKEANHWSTDGWDRMCDWQCTHPNVKQDGTVNKIAGSVEWHEEKDVQIPTWCPLIKNNQKEK